MLYTVYKTTNLANGKYYFGVHKTEDPNDDYLGSGKYIKAAIAKYGEAALMKKALFIYRDADSAFGKEDELIQCYRGRDSLCMNLRKGGSGGFDWINREGLNNSNNNMRKGGAASAERTRSDDVVMARLVESMKRIRKLRTNAYLERIPSMLKKWTGSHHTLAARLVMSDKHKGEKNTQFGKKWMFNLILRISRPVKADKVDSYLLDGWILGRKMKF